MVIPIRHSLWYTFLPFTAVLEATSMPSVDRESRRIMGETPPSPSSPPTSSIGISCYPSSPSPPASVAFACLCERPFLPIAAPYTQMDKM
ncbi:unnamed protein product [Linum trigynum]|uniref:Secreted protein n=1 Tax=Linum trigynum TaxID=586398 RepID=A0AAV2EW35_9ROSI